MDITHRVTGYDGRNSSNGDQDTMGGVWGQDTRGGLTGGLVMRAINGWMDGWVDGWMDGWMDGACDERGTRAGGQGLDG